MSPISRRVLLRRNATRDPEHAWVAQGWRYVVLRGPGKDAGQNDERKRKDEREKEREERKRKGGRERERDGERKIQRG